jgi:adenylate cyclase
MQRQLLGQDRELRFLVSFTLHQETAMAQEIERKFLLAGDGWRNLAEGVEYRQGYLCAAKERSVRVRIAGERGYLTVKGATVGASRSEYEYEIPLADARSMLDDLCPQPQIEKKRYAIAYQGFVWEVDEFFGLNQGLIVAEIELEHEQQSFPRPDWIGAEVTGDARYYNAALCDCPYSSWPPSVVAEENANNHK